MNNLTVVLEALKGKRLTAFSPHPDDLALSAGSFLSLLSRHTEITAFTCFSRSRYAPYLASNGLEAEELGRLRKAEEEAFFERMGISGRFLDFEDASLRGYGARTEREVRLEQEPSWPIFRRRLKDLIGTLECDAFLCPSALGNHIDHLMVRQALVEADRSSGCIFYEDLPYAAELRSAELDGVIGELLDRPQALIVPFADACEEKAACLEFYPSQIGMKEMNVVSSYARNVAATHGPAERLWVSKVLLDSFSRRLSDRINASASAEAGVSSPRSSFEPREIG